jgi:hypothetical protein
MARRTQLHKVVPWVGGVNTSVDPGVLNEQELVQADNVIFSSTGARIKRTAMEYLDNAIPSPDYRSSSGTTRTLKWTTNRLIGINAPDQRLVARERITITGTATNYNIVDVAITAVTSVPQVTSVTCVGDTSGSLNNTYFYISAGDGGIDYYVWFNVNAAGVDPNIASKTGVEIALSTNATASTVATAVAAALDALDDFAASAVGAVVTVTNAIGGVTTDGSAQTSGATVSVTTKGGHTITYTHGDSLSESSTAAGTVTIARASSIINVTDFWYFDGTSDNTQRLVYMTDDFQMFYMNTDKRIQILGQPQVSSVVCGNAASLTTGDYFLLYSANDATTYYVWYNKDTGGGDPALPNKTGVEIAVTTGDTASQVATATKVAIDALADFSASVSTDTVTVTNADPGITTATVDSNTGFTISTTTWGATAPAASVSQIRTTVMNEQLIVVFSGLGNYPIKYNPTSNAKYQVLVDDPTNDSPDGDIIFQHLNRLWMNDKVNKHRWNYSETFDETIWLGVGDSGAIDISPGDGDPEGIVNGFSYKGAVYTHKRTKYYRVLGVFPEEFQVELVSDGIGAEANLAIPVDQTDVVFVSRRGIHSQEATDRFGDVDNVYLSSKIKPTFNSWEPSLLNKLQGVYIPDLNSIAFGVTEDNQTSNNAVWLYNTEVDLGERGRGAWYRWPDVSCTAVSRMRYNDQFRAVFGTVDGRLIRAQTINDWTDFGTDGIPLTIRTGTIYPGSDVSSMKSFKKISMLYRPQGNFSFTVKVYIDNFAAQSFSFNQVSGLDLLGQTFILGNSLLGASAGLAPYTWTMDGIGRGMVIEVTQPTADEQVEIWGFMVEYENLDIEQEVT